MVVGAAHTLLGRNHPNVLDAPIAAELALLALKLVAALRERSAFRAAAVVHLDDDHHLVAELLAHTLVPRVRVGRSWVEGEGL